MNIADSETTSYVEPTGSTTDPDVKPAHDRDWPTGSISFLLPQECVVVRVGERYVYSPPKNLDGTEQSEWNQCQFDLQELIERLGGPVDVMKPPADDAISVGAQATTRDELRKVVASADYWSHRVRMTLLELERATLEQRLLKLVWISQYRELDRSVANAEAGSNRVIAARERLSREAPMELHSRLHELTQAKRLATHEVNEKGQIGGHRVDWLRVTVDRLKMLPSLNSGEAYDLRKYEAELAERTETLAKVESEIAELERQMLLA